MGAATNRGIVMDLRDLAHRRHFREDGLVDQAEAAGLWSRFLPTCRNGSTRSSPTVS